ncbi:hypothetical protein MRB53_038196 [Persea americana]|nr:hypothetical protein MRB53_038196 [Persea americana]
MLVTVVGDVEDIVAAVDDEFDAVTAAMAGLDAWLGVVLTGVLACEVVLFEDVRTLLKVLCSVGVDMVGDAVLVEGAGTGEEAAVEGVAGAIWEFVGTCTRGRIVETIPKDEVYDTKGVLTELCCSCGEAMGTDTADDARGALEGEGVGVVAEVGTAAVIGGAVVAAAAFDTTASAPTPKVGNGTLPSTSHSPG